MIEFLLSIALLSGAEQVGNKVILDKDVIQRVEAKTGMNVFSIPENAHYRITKNYSTEVLIVIQEHNGAN